MIVNRWNFDKVNDLRLQSYVCTLTGQGNIQWKDPVAVAEDLPTTWNQINDHRWCKDDGFVYKWDGEEWNKVHVPGDWGAENLSQLTDVSLTDLQDWDVLSYDATSEKFKNKAIFNPEITTPADWDIVKYNETTEKWENETTLEWIPCEHGNTCAQSYNQFDVTRITNEWYINFKAWTTVTAKSGYAFWIYDYTTAPRTQLWSGWGTSMAIENNHKYRIAIKKTDDAKFTIAELDQPITTYIEISDWDYTVLKRKKSEKHSKREWKYITFIGDSITAWTWYDTWYWYFDHLKRMLKLGGINVEATAWSCVSKTSDYWTSNNPISQRAISDNAKQSDLIIFFAGTNDYWHDTPIGQFARDTADQDTSMYSAMRITVGKMIAWVVGARIAWMTPLHRKKLWSDTTKTDDTLNWQNKCLDDYIKVIKEVCATYSVPVIDTNAISGLNPRTLANNEAYFTDWLHPNERGQLMLARAIKSYIEML